MEIEKFYNELSLDYDSMTEFKSRIEREKSFFIKICEDYKITSALDFGCGTGLHSFLIDNLDISVTGIDISQKMIEKAKENAKKLNKNINFLVIDMKSNIPDNLTKFDSIFCMGNTIAHFLDPNNLTVMIRNCFNLLNPNGIFIVQLLNYKRILDLKERIINIREEANKTFIRFYDFINNKIIFNILILEKKGKIIEHKLISTELFPFTKEDLLNQFQKNGFNIVSTYGNMKFENFDPGTSPNLILLLKR